MTAEKKNIETEQPAVDSNERFAGISFAYRHQAIGKQDVRNITNKLNQEQPIIRGFRYAAKTLLPNPCTKRLQTKVKRTQPQEIRNNKPLPLKKLQTTYPG